jgi:hypothetical protein
MNRDPLVQQGFLHTEALTGAVYVHAIGFRDRLIGAVRNILIFLVDQTDVAKHIAVESEDGREAIWHPVVEPPQRCPQAISLQSHLELRRDTRS